jgi:uncharacterized lipoprotein
MPLRLVALIALLVVPLAGCGTSQRDQYRQDFRKVSDRFRASVQKTGTQVRSGATLHQRVPALRSFKASVEQLASDLEHLHPPGDLKQAQGDAVRQLRTLANDLSDYESAAVAGDERGARRIVPKLQADQTVLQKTLDELDRRVRS